MKKNLHSVHRTFCCIDPAGLCRASLNALVCGTLGAHARVSSLQLQAYIQATSLGFKKGNSVQHEALSYGNSAVKPSSLRHDVGALFMFRLQVLSRQVQFLSWSCSFKQRKTLPATKSPVPIPLCMATNNPHHTLNSKKRLQQQTCKRTTILHICRYVFNYACIIYTYIYTAYQYMCIIHIAAFNTCCCVLAALNHPYKVVGRFTSTGIPNYPPASVSLLMVLASLWQAQVASEA